MGACESTTAPIDALNCCPSKHPGERFVEQRDMMDVMRKERATRQNFSFASSTVGAAGSPTMRGVRPVVGRHSSTTPPPDGGHPRYYGDILEQLDQRQQPAHAPPAAETWDPDYGKVHVFPRELSLNPNWPSGRLAPPPPGDSPNPHMRGSALNEVEATMKRYEKQKERAEEHRVALASLADKANGNRLYSVSKMDSAQNIQMGATSAPSASKPFRAPPRRPQRMAIV